MRWGCRLPHGIEKTALPLSASPSYGPLDIKGPAKVERALISRATPATERSSGFSRFLAFRKKLALLVVVPEKVARWRSEAGVIRDYSNQTKPSYFPPI
ncbi:hypothetical protein CEXT_165391 [Caerostris extrusa]|uniref:Uncharacterized protein n=1 Tax=Caerostris extrusa TaxID=172846 RepID=A0AAV4T9B5_CAEEX|nr:hypothetical protein CEXT_165391 [Caerostris extrusa]